MSEINEAGKRDERHQHMCVCVRAELSQAMAAAAAASERTNSLSFLLVVRGVFLSSAFGRYFVFYEAIEEEADADVRIWSERTKELCLPMFLSASFFLLFLSYRSLPSTLVRCEGEEEDKETCELSIKRTQTHIRAWRRFDFESRAPADDDQYLIMNEERTNVFFDDQNISVVVIWNKRCASSLERWAGSRSFVLRTINRFYSPRHVRNERREDEPGRQKKK